MKNAGTCMKMLLKKTQIWQMIRILLIVLFVRICSTLNMTSWSLRKLIINFQKLSDRLQAPPNLMLGPSIANCAAKGFLSNPPYRSTRPRSTSGSYWKAQSEAASNGSWDVPKVNVNYWVIIKRSNKPIQALNLPVIANINPRSIYNKVNEFHTFVEQEKINVIFMSESWERENKQLDEIIK